MKTRKWNLTINQASEAWYKHEDIIRDLSRCRYAYIIHNKDNEEQPHIHLCLWFDNARSFESIKNTFKGAHIEPCNYWNMSIQYLIHKNDKEKYQYAVEDVIHNLGEDLLSYLMLDEFEIINTENLLAAVCSGEVYDLKSAVVKWGVNQVSLKINLIEKLIKNEFDGVSCRLKKEAEYYKQCYNELVDKYNYLALFLGHKKIDRKE